MPLADAPMQHAEIMIWMGVVLMATGALGLFNFVAAKVIWSSVSGKESPAYDFVGASSLLTVGWGIWLVIEHL